MKCSYTFLLVVVVKQQSSAHLMLPGGAAGLAVMKMFPAMELRFHIVL